VAYLLLNAENSFKKSGIKEVSSKRRERLDSEFGVDRKEMQKNFQTLDNMYRVTEKEEIKKFSRIGKTPKEYYEQKEMMDELERQKLSEGIIMQDGHNKRLQSIDKIKEQFLKKSKDEMEVTEV